MVPSAEIGIGILRAGGHAWRVEADLFAIAKGVAESPYDHFVPFESRRDLDERAIVDAG
jgi:hypothetical protein